MNFLNKYFHILILFLFCLTPIIWFIGKGNVLINGLDTNFPLDPFVWFLRRFFVWNDVVNFGSDFSSSTGGIFFHLIQTVFFWITSSLQLTEVLSLIFWFSAIVLAAYFFASSFTTNKAARVIFVLIYSFNTYLFNSWENVKVSNLALVVSIPLFLGLINYYKNNFLNKKELFIRSTLVSIFTTGASINPAYFLTIILGIFVYIFVLMVISKEKQQMIKLFYGLIIINSAIFLINLFWLLPLTNFIFVAKKISSLTDIGFTNWLDSLSENTNLLNVLRLQGAWDWYAKDSLTGAPLYIPYAANYFYKWPFIIYSFILPVGSIISLIFTNKAKREYYIFFAILMVMGVFLGAGTHDPTGGVFRFLTLHIPFFSFFRSPWYIFTPLLIISFAGLWALLYTFLSPKINKARLNIVVAVFIISYLIYCYPQVTGKIFRPQAEGFYIYFPDYVFLSKDYLDQRDSHLGRIITYPDDQLEQFNWGYKGTESILSLFSDKEIITPSFNYSNKVLQSLIDQFYLHIKKGEYDSALSILPLFDADTIFNKKDVKGSLSEKIDESNNVLLTKTTQKKIGEWTFMELINKSGVDKIYIPDSIFLNLSSPDSLNQLASYFPKKSLSFNDLTDSIIDLSQVYNRASTFGDVRNNTLYNNPTSRIHQYTISATRESTYSLIIEKKGLTGVKDIQFSLDNNKLSTKDIIETDSLLSFNAINLTKGDHNLEIFYPENTNLIDNQHIENPLDFGALREELKTENSKQIIAYSDSNFERKIKIPVLNFNPFLSYDLTYDYKHFYGNPPVLEVVQSATTAPVKSYTAQVGFSMDWEHKATLVESVPITSKLDLIFHLPINHYGNKSKTFLENISLNRIYDNKVFIVESKKAESSYDNLPITYSKKSPVEYEVNIDKSSKDFYLVFLESYSSDWILKKDGKREKAPHFTANGYANGWYISAKSTPSRFTIYYSPQRQFNIGLVVSILTLISAMLIFIFGKFRKI